MSWAYRKRRDQEECKDSRHPGPQSSRLDEYSCRRFSRHRLPAAQYNASARARHSGARRSFQCLTIDRRSAHPRCCPCSTMIPCRSMMTRTHFLASRFLRLSCRADRERVSRKQKSPQSAGFLVASKLNSSPFRDRRPFTVRYARQGPTRKDRCQRQSPLQLRRA